MRVSTSEKLAVYILKEAEREGGDLLLYGHYPSISEAVKAAKKHLSKKGLRGKYKLLFWQGSKFWRRTITIEI